MLCAGAEAGAGPLLVIPPQPKVSIHIADAVCFVFKCCLLGCRRHWLEQIWSARAGSTVCSNPASRSLVHSPTQKLPQVSVLRCPRLCVASATMLVIVDDSDPRLATSCTRLGAVGAHVLHKSAILACFDSSQCSHCVCLRWIVVFHWGSHMSPICLTFTPADTKKANGCLIVREAARHLAIVLTLCLQLLLALGP
eukprot:5679448-Amphidinium_carterae.1